MVVIVLLAFLTAANQHGLDFERAAKEIVRIAPASVPAIPAAVRDDLTRRGCRIPQHAEANQPNNVIHGALRAPGSVDWAALCSRQGKSRVLIYWNGNPHTLTALDEVEDTDLLQQVIGNRIGFMLELSVASARTIRDYLTRDVGEGLTPAIEPSEITHDGFDLSTEKSGRIFYWHRGKLRVVHWAD